MLPTLWQLYLMRDFAVADGAVCLDGSPAGFYYRPATDPANKNDWVIHFQGDGGLASSDASSVARLLTRAEGLRRRCQAAGWLGYTATWSHITPHPTLY